MNGPNVEVQLANLGSGGGYLEVRSYYRHGDSPGVVVSVMLPSDKGGFEGAGVVVDALKLRAIADAIIRAEDAK